MNVGRTFHNPHFITIGHILDIEVLIRQQIDFVYVMEQTNVHIQFFLCLSEWGAFKYITSHFQIKRYNFIRIEMV